MYSKPNKSVFEDRSEDNKMIMQLSCPNQNKQQDGTSVNTWLELGIFKQLCNFLVLSKYM